MIYLKTFSFGLIVLKALNDITMDLYTSFKPLSLKERKKKQKKREKK